MENLDNGPFKDGVAVKRDHFPHKLLHPRKLSVALQHFTTRFSIVYGKLYSS